MRLEPERRQGGEILVTFDPLAWPGSKTLCVAGDGAHMLLAAADGRTHRLWLPEGLPGPGTPLVCVVEPDAYGNQRGEAAIAFWRDVLDAGRPGHRLPPRRKNVVRGDAMRRVLILRAVDADQAGATPREIAEALFDKERLTRQPEWKTSALRYQVIRLIEAGRKLIAGGYRQLLRPIKDRR